LSPFLGGRGATRVGRGRRRAAVLQFDEQNDTQYHLAMGSDTTVLLDALDRTGHRLTEPRLALAGLIAAREGHFTAADLVADARARHLVIGRATIFRALDLFTDLNVVERLELPSGEHAYVPCEPHHHHHVICSRCGRTDELGDWGMSTVVQEVASRTGYRIDTHRLEMFGLCPACAASGNPAEPAGGVTELGNAAIAAPGSPPADGPAQA
jgi:Fe2+ or Zn2+ uptake regulation protein